MKLIFKIFLNVCDIFFLGVSELPPSVTAHTFRTFEDGPRRGAHLLYL